MEVISTNNDCCDSKSNNENTTKECAVEKPVIISNISSENINVDDSDQEDFLLSEDDEEEVVTVSNDDKNNSVNNNDKDKNDVNVTSDNIIDIIDVQKWITNLLGLSYNIEHQSIDTPLQEYDGYNEYAKKQIHQYILSHHNNQQSVSITKGNNDDNDNKSNSASSNNNITKKNDDDNNDVILENVSIRTIYERIVDLIENENEVQIKRTTTYIKAMEEQQQQVENDKRKSDCDDSNTQDNNVSVVVTEGNIDNKVLEDDMEKSNGDDSNPQGKEVVVVVEGSDNDNEKDLEEDMATTSQSTGQDDDDDEEEMEMEVTDYSLTNEETIVLDHTLSSSVLDVEINVNDKIAILTMLTNKICTDMINAINKVIPELMKKQQNDDIKSIILLAAEYLTDFHTGVDFDDVCNNNEKSNDNINDDNLSSSSPPTSRIALIVRDYYNAFAQLGLLQIPTIVIMNGVIQSAGLLMGLCFDYRIITNDINIYFSDMLWKASPSGKIANFLYDYIPQPEIIRALLEQYHLYSEDCIRLQLTSSLICQNEDVALENAKQFAMSLSNRVEKQSENNDNGTNDKDKGNKLEKMSKITEAIDEISWHIAQGVQHFSMHRVNNAWMLDNNDNDGKYGTVGIVAMETCTPGHAIAANLLGKGGLFISKDSGLKSVPVWDRQEDTVSMSLNALVMLLENHVKNINDIGILDVAAESNHHARYLLSNIKEMLPHAHINDDALSESNYLRSLSDIMFELLAWCRQTNKYGVLIVPSDLGQMDFHHSKSACVVALLLGPTPWIEICPQSVSCGKILFDGTTTTADMNGCVTATGNNVESNEFKISVKNYIKALGTCIEKCRKEININPSTQLDTIIFHGGNCLKYMDSIEKYLLAKIKPKNKWKQKFKAARYCTARLGNTNTASVFVNLQSLLARTSDSTTITHIGLFTYGPGISATFMHAKIYPERSHIINLPQRLDKRQHVTYEVVQKILQNNPLFKPVLIERTRGSYYRDLLFKLRPIYYRENQEEKPNWLDKDFMVSYQGMQSSGLKNTGQFITKMVAILFLTVSTVWWIGVLISMLTDVDTVKTISLGINVSVACYITKRMLEYYLEKHGMILSAATFALKSLSILTCLAYVLLYIITGPDRFSFDWTIIFLGYHLHSNLTLIQFWERLEVTWRSQLVCHNFLILMCTGIWFAMDAEWSETTSLGVLLWLTVDIWQTAVSFRQRPDLLSTFLHVFSFGIAMIQRVAAYILLNNANDIPFATLLVVDICDILVQFVLFVWKENRRDRVIHDRSSSNEENPESLNKGSLSNINSLSNYTEEDWRNLYTVKKKLNGTEDNNNKDDAIPKFIEMSESSNDDDHLNFIERGGEYPANGGISNLEIR